jgi:hypothetical protein
LASKPTVASRATGARSRRGAGWTGRTEIALINGRGQQVGAVAVAIQPSSLTLRHRNRLIAELDREVFHEWLFDPQGPLRCHDVIWFIHTGLTCISITGLGAFVVPGSCIANLMAVV